jgi:ankyrin repeat protein
MLAASRGQAESVDVLLAHGADPNAVDANGTTPLKAALAADQPAIVAALRRAGAR